MNVIFRKAFTFDDVLLVPKHSDIKSRSEVDLSVDLGHRGLKLKIPIVSANMKTVTGIEMSKTISNLGGLPVFHRFKPIDEIIKEIKNSNSQLPAVSVGIGETALDDVKKYHENGFTTICIDVAHGHHDGVIKLIKKIRQNISDDDFNIIAGNVATGWGAKELALAGANIIKTGIGSGSLCSTRTETGNGVPQLTALMDVSKELEPMRDNVSIIADGGIRKAGDVVKALVFADAVMLGSVLAGTYETPGPLFTSSKKRVELEDIKSYEGLYKSYEGSSTHKQNHIEGVKRLIPCKGPVSNVIQTFLEGIKSGFSYQGARNLSELRENVEFVELTHASLVESRPMR